MVILEEPYISQMLLGYLKENKVPVLENLFAKSLGARGLNLRPASEAIEGYATSKKIYIVSEYALDWVVSELNDAELNRQVDLLKDKAAFREACRTLYPGFLYKTIPYAGLAGFDISAVPFPFVLKPAVGFLSAGVYTVFDRDDWTRALEEIGENFQKLADTFPDAVVGDQTFVLESYIPGREFALDLYFRDGKPVIVNIFEHPFSSGKDVSDRLYLTGKHLFDRWLEPFTAYMTRLNEALHLDRIPVHVELRVDGDTIVPIEVNPLRFAGMCLNEIGFYITGQHPLHYYLTDTAPDYESMWRGKEDETFCFSILERPTVTTAAAGPDAIKSLYSEMLEWRTVENSQLNIDYFVFSKTKNPRELDDILALKR